MVNLVDHDHYRLGKGPHGLSCAPDLIAPLHRKKQERCNLRSRQRLADHQPLYLDNKVPFFYLWDFKAQSDQRFSRLNPGLNLTYWAVRQGTQLNLIPDLEEEDLNKVACLATKLDHFFQQMTRISAIPIWYSSSISKGGREGLSNEMRRRSPTSPNSTTTRSSKRRRTAGTGLSFSGDGGKGSHATTT